MPAQFSTQRSAETIPSAGRASVDWALAGGHFDATGLEAPFVNTAVICTKEQKDTCLIKLTCFFKESLAN